MAIAAVAKTIDNFSYITSAVLTPLFLVAGTFFPISKANNMGLWVAAQFNPLYHCVELVRNATFGELGPADLYHAAVLIGFALLMWRAGRQPARPAADRLARAESQSPLRLHTDSPFILTIRMSAPPNSPRFAASSSSAAAPVRVGRPWRLRDRAGAVAVRIGRPELWALLGLTAFLNLWDLSRNGWANVYYSAAVRSMSSSWHDFLYASFDRSGVMTVDKPPLALWVQSLSVRAFGYHPMSLLVPQALMGMASVVLVYDLVRRRFGRSGASSRASRWRSRR